MGDYLESDDESLEAILAKLKEYSSVMHSAATSTVLEKIHPDLAPLKGDLKELAKEIDKVVKSIEQEEKEKAKERKLEADEADEEQELEPGSPTAEALALEQKEERKKAEADNYRVAKSLLITLKNPNEKNLNNFHSVAELTRLRAEMYNIERILIRSKKVLGVAALAVGCALLVSSLGPAGVVGAVLATLLKEAVTEWITDNRVKKPLSKKADTAKDMRNRFYKKHDAIHRVGDLVEKHTKEPRAPRAR